MRRDTVLVRPDGHVVLRYKAENPGIWLFHCHIEWHVSSGLSITLIEDPLTLQQSLPSLLTTSTITNTTTSNNITFEAIPASHFSACALNNPATPTTGNAAGNTLDLLNLKGEPAPANPLPAGFEAKGIVALVFSCIAAFLGVAVIGWYGMKETSGSFGQNGRGTTVGGDGKEGAGMFGKGGVDGVGAKEGYDGSGKEGISAAR